MEKKSGAGTVRVHGFVDEEDSEGEGYLYHGGCGTSKMANGHLCVQGNARKEVGLKPVQTRAFRLEIHLQERVCLREVN